MRTIRLRLNALNRLLLALGALSLLFTAAPAYAEEDFYCEVMTVEGTVTLSNATTSGKALGEGDLLSVDDVVSVGEGGYTDIAYDKDWNNVTRVEENSSVRIRSLNPTTLALEKGGVFAKLKALPKDSSFDVQTPTAIASVRGTEYRTTFLEGETEVYNVSDSDVYVFGVDNDGEKQTAEPVVIRNSEKTFIQKRGEPPVAPRRMEAHEMQKASQFRQGIEQKVMQNVGRGRVGKLPNVRAIEQRMQERRGPNGSDNQNGPQRMGKPEGQRGPQNGPQNGPGGQKQGQHQGQGKPGPRPRAQH